MSPKSLDTKLEKIKNDTYTPSDFVIADAKDGDMAFGVLSPDSGTITTRPPKTRADHLAAITEMTQSTLVDVMLMSASVAESLHLAGVFNDSPVTPAIRMNDTTDIWSARGSNYRQYPSRPFASADLDAVSGFCDLGLYSATFSNDLEADLATLEAYRSFRLQCRGTGFRHFLEVFNPAIDIGIPPAEMGNYVNDMIIKAVAGVTRADAPGFLKVQFNGAQSMSDLCRYDPEGLIVGILGGAKGTTRDTFELVLQAEQAGARVALFGRKINLAEAPLELVRLMRKTIAQAVTTEQAVKDYHAYLADQNLTPRLTLAEDLQVTDPVLQQ